MARTTPVNAGYTIINGTTTGSNASRVNTWVEYKVTGNKLHVLLYAQANWDSGTSTGGAKKNFGYCQMNGGTKQYLNTDYDFGYLPGTSTPRINKFADHTFNIPEGTETVKIYAYYKTDSSFISVGQISETTIKVSADGTVQIFVNGGWQKAIPYVFDNGGWKKAKPYLFVSNEWKEVK